MSTISLYTVLVCSWKVDTGFSFANNHTQSIHAFSSAIATTSTTTTLPFVVVSPLSATSPPTEASSTSQPTLQTASTPANQTSNNDSSSLSGGAIAGIVVGVLAGVIIICFLLFKALRRQRQKQQPQQPPMTNNFHAISTANEPTMPVTAAAGPALLSRQTPDDPWLGQVPLGTYTVVSTYNPSLEDEIYVLPGDIVQVYAEYDDGWCLGMNISRGNARGVFPKTSITVDQVTADEADRMVDTEQTSSQLDKRRSRRTSSLFNTVQNAQNIK